MSKLLQSTDIATSLPLLLEEVTSDKIFVLTDTNTAKYCYPLVREGLEQIPHELIVVPEGEANKTLATAEMIWSYLTQNGATRHSLLINLGGGTITDIGGFVAATFKRGIQCINIPTTVLGAVDAAIGGKTGVNFGGLKNEIGAFSMPRYILISTQFFATLSVSQYRNGLAEILKHALLDDDKIWRFLISLDGEKYDMPQITDLIYKSAQFKQRIVDKDPTDIGFRKSLNLGHTFGHAFESLAIKRGEAIGHGYAVAFGLIPELYLSHKQCGFPKETLLETIRFIHQTYGVFPIDCSDYETLYELMSHDKKNRSRFIMFSLLAEVGYVMLNEVADKTAIFEALDFYRDSVGL